MPFSGALLYKLRGEKGLSRSQLARLAGTTAQYISHLENRVKDNPTFELVERLAEALGVTLLELRVDPADAPPRRKQRLEEKRRLKEEIDQLRRKMGVQDGQPPATVPTAKPKSQ